MPNIRTASAVCLTTGGQRRSLLLRAAAGADGRGGDVTALVHLMGRH